MDDWTNAELFRLYASLRWRFHRMADSGDDEGVLLYQAVQRVMNLMLCRSAA